MRSFPSFGSFFFKISPFDTNCCLSSLIANVALIIGLFEASFGASILMVFGTKTHFSDFSSSVQTVSLVCFPSVGEPLPEQQLLLVEEVGERQALDPIDTAPVPAFQSGVPLQYDGGTNCKGMLGGHMPGIATIGVGHHCIAVGPVLLYGLHIGAEDR